MFDRFCNELLGSILRGALLDELVPGAAKDFPMPRPHVVFCFGVQSPILMGRSTGT